MKSDERFGNGHGESGWFWENGGVGMGGKTAGKFYFSVFILKIFLNILV